MDFLPTDSVSLLVRITIVESIHAPSILIQLCGLLLSTLKFTFKSQISRFQEKSSWAKITKFLDYLGEGEKNPKKIHIYKKPKNPKQFLYPYKETARDSSEDKNTTSKTRADSMLFHQPWLIQHPGLAPLLNYSAELAWGVIM